MIKSIKTILILALFLLPFGIGKFHTPVAEANTTMCFVEGEVAEGFQYASTVVEVHQGLKKNGTAVNPGRSIPTQGLAFEAAQNESSFFSLGFNGSIIVEFTNPIFNGSGNDLKLTEDTWGVYPLERADVFVSQDNITWYFLGIANNTNHINIHTVSEFDLGILTWAKYVKIVDTTDPAPLPADSDGYDLNAVEALYSGVLCNPSITIDKEADLLLPYEVYVGENVTYAYEITNNGNVPLIINSLTDDKCGTPTFISGDNGNNLLDVNEIWSYQCSMELTQTTENIATVTAHDDFGTQVSASDSVTVAVKGPKCTLTQGYWKTHSTNGPAPVDPDWNGLENTTFYSSGQTYYQVLWTAPHGNAYYQLAHQFIATTLNGLTSEIYSTWEAANNLLIANPPENLVIPKGKPSEAYKNLRQQFITLAGELGAYNEGLTGPGHCSE